MAMLARHSRATIARPLLYGLAAFRYAPYLQKLLAAPNGSLLRSYLTARPEIWSLLRVRFISLAWPAGRRFAEIIGHCRTVEALGAPFNLQPHEAAELIGLDDIAPGLSLVLDSPRWMTREGLLSLSLQQNGERLFTLAFTIADHDGERIAHSGGVQGRRGEDTLERYRELTRLAEGLRPADLLFELFRLVCQQAGVDRIRGVSTAMHPPQTRADGSPLPITFDYDRYWSERGGVPRPDGMFDLPVHATSRPLGEVPARKRAQRRRRAEMMAAIATKLAAAFADPRRLPVLAREPEAG